MTTDCDIERLQQWFDGELSDSERECTERHVAQCVACRTRVAWWTSLRASARDVMRQRNPAGTDEQWSRLIARRRQPRKRALWLLPTALAAAVILLLVGSPFSRFGRGIVPDPAPARKTTAAIAEAEARVADEWKNFSSSVADLDNTAALTKADRHAAAVMQRLKEDAEAVAALSLESGR